ncbi:hypothetical protein Dimus_012029 [Dionaea muscipula]
MNPEFSPASSAAAKACTICRSDNRWILHNIRLRGSYHRICTSCVLKLHPSSFCPHCFLVFENAIHPSPSSSHPTTTTTANINNRGSLLCIKCSSRSHSTCIPPNSPKSPYLCPPCTNPNFNFFDFKFPSSKNNGRDVPNSRAEQLSLDQRSAKALLAAAKIAAGSMSKAAALFRIEAEKRVKEAALSRKMAKESLERVIFLWERLAEGTGEVEVLGSVPPQKRDCFSGGMVSVPTRTVNHNLGGGGRSEIRVTTRNLSVPMDKIVVLPMEVDSSASASASASEFKKDNLVGRGGFGSASSSVAGKVGGGYVEAEEDVAVHMDVDATASLPKSVKVNNVGGETEDMENDVHKHNALLHEEKSEAVQMEVEAANSMRNKGSLGVVNEVSVDKVDAGGRRRDTGIDVQTLVVQMEKNGGIIANGSAGVELGAASPPSVGEEKNFDSMNEKDETQLEEEEKEISEDDKMGDDGLASSSSELEQHPDDNKHG